MGGITDKETLDVSSSAQKMLFKKPALSMAIKEFGISENQYGVMAARQIKTTQTGSNTSKDRHQTIQPAGTNINIECENLETN